MKVVMCGKFRVGVVVFDKWGGREVGLLDLRKVFCDRYESVTRHDDLLAQWAVVNVLVFVYWIVNGGCCC